MDTEYEKSEEAKKNKDWSLVKQIVEPLAKNGHAKSQARLGALYRLGLGVSKNVIEAIKWTTLAAEQGDVKGQFNLGLTYYNGDGVTQDHDKAFKLYTKAAEQGHAQAQGKVGFMYSTGQGVPQDYKEAIKWFRLAAEQGDAGAKFNLGIMYDNGYGVPQDNKEAVKWYTKAAEQGHAQAQLQVGLAYVRNQSFKESIKWLKLAADQGTDQAQKFLKMVETKEKERLAKAASMKSGGSASGQLTQDIRDTVAKNLMQLEFTLNCEKCDLRGAELSNKILKKANLKESDLRWADLTGANLSYANLEGADVRYANLEGADVRYADMDGVNLSHANLKNLKFDKGGIGEGGFWGLYGVNLTEANLEGWDFSEIALKKVILTGKLNEKLLRGASLYEVNLAGANLSGMRLTGASLLDVNLTGANLSGTILGGPVKLYDVASNLGSANLSRANLKGANLVNVNLFLAELRHADLSEAKMNYALLQDATLKGANLTKADLTGAKLNRATLWKANLSGANLKGADLSGAYLQEADLTGANLQGANFKDADITNAFIDLNELTNSNLTGAIGLKKVQSAKNLLAKQKKSLINETFQDGIDALREEDYKRALEIFKPLVGKGQLNAMYQLSKMYKFGWGVEKNIDRADELFNEVFKLSKPLAEKGDTDAQTQMGHAYHYGSAVIKRNIDVAIIWYSLAAAKGNIEAISKLGFIYLFGKHNKDWEPDHEKAKKYFLILANQGNMNAMLKMAEIQRNLKKYLEAETWYERYLNKEKDDEIHWTTYRDIADLYGDVPPSFPNGWEKMGKFNKLALNKALTHVEQYKAKKNGYALVSIGEFYETGTEDSIGVKRNYLEAIKFYYLANFEDEFGTNWGKAPTTRYDIAKRPPLKRLRDLLEARDDGEFREEEEEAYEIRLGFAMQGDPVAQLKIGESYIDGYLVEKNKMEAIKWWKLSAKQGNQDAKIKLQKYDAQGEIERVKRIDQCVLEMDSMKRLACFDSLPQEFKNQECSSEKDSLKKLTCYEKTTGKNKCSAGTDSLKRLTCYDSLPENIKGQKCSAISDSLKRLSCFDNQ